LPVHYLLLSSVDTLGRKARNKKEIVQNIQEPEFSIQTIVENEGGNSSPGLASSSGTQLPHVETETDLIPEEYYKEEDKKGNYGFTKGVVDPNAYEKVESTLGRSVNISTHIQGEVWEKYVDLLKAYEKVFAWSHEDLKGIDPKYGQHQIDLMEGAIPIRQKQYRLNPKYLVAVKDEIDKLTRAGFIYPILSSEWVSPIVIVAKKSGPNGKPKIRVCHDFQKLNDAAQKDHYPLPFIDAVLDTVSILSLMGMQVTTKYRFD
jgi:hypothetical protein